MSDYRDPNDRFYGNTGYEPAGRTSGGWGWIAGAAILVIILAVAFGIGRSPNRVASNDVGRPPATTHTAPTNPLNPAANPPGLNPPPAAAPGSSTTRP